jgi:hypothetical protein
MRKKFLLEIIASHPYRFMPPKRASGTRIEGWMGPRAGLDDMERRKFGPYLDSNSDLSVKSVSSRYTDYATAPLIIAGANVLMYTCNYISIVYIFHSPLPPKALSSFM